MVSQFRRTLVIWTQDWVKGSVRITQVSVKRDLTIFGHCDWMEFGLEAISKPRYSFAHINLEILADFHLSFISRSLNNILLGSVFFHKSVSFKVSGGGYDPHTLYLKFSRTLHLNILL